MTAGYYQMLSGHAMTVAFLGGRWGWVELDQCWWCSKDRQNREQIRWGREVSGENEGRVCQGGCPHEELDLSFVYMMVSRPGP